MEGRGGRGRSRGEWGGRARARSGEEGGGEG